MKRKAFLSYILNQTFGNFSFNILLSLYSILVMIRINDTLSDQIKDFKGIFFESLLLLFFYLIGIFLVEILTQGKRIEQTNNLYHYLSLLILKAIIFTFIPIILTFFHCVSLGSIASFNFNFYTFLSIFLLMLYWFSLTNVIALYLKKYAFLTLILFVCYPAISEALESYTWHDYSPFMITINTAQKLPGLKYITTEIVLLTFYLLLILFLIVIKINKLCKK